MLLILVQAVTVPEILSFEIFDLAKVGQGHGVKTGNGTI